VSLLVTGIFLTSLTGCSLLTASPAVTVTGSGTVGTSVSGPIDVLAAASLKEPFITLGKQFQAAHAGTEVHFRFGSSPELAAQILHGAHADVLAAAPADMDVVRAAQYLTQPVPFAKNAAIATIVTESKNNPATVRAFIDYVLSPQGQAVLTAAGFGNP